MDPGHRTNDAPQNLDETLTTTDVRAERSGLKKLDEPYFAYGDHADVYKGIFDGKPVVYFAYGDHADVYKGILDGKPVAIKQLRGVNSNKTDVRDNLRVGLRRQFSEHWRDLDHPNVCRVYKIVEDYGFLPALVLNYYPRGSLIKYIEKNDPPFQQRLKWASDIAAGLAYLHSHNVCHGDLRGANVFLDKKYGAVLTDYGIAQYFNKSDFTSAKSTCIFRWKGPEVNALKPDADIAPDKLDVWAMGMTLVEIFSGQPPYADKSDTSAIFAIHKGELPKLPESITQHPELKNVFDLCTRKSPLKRPSAEEVAELLRVVSRIEVTRLIATQALLVSLSRPIEAYSEDFCATLFHALGINMQTQARMVALALASSSLTVGIIRCNTPSSISTQSVALYPPTITHLYN
ncbi:Serine/threonine-protein kinase sepA [Leucoagaricus sp. SymC.cos]|nr:Serine/threonine-protein kinase sepA [Leucoagaricus sp. SymC.cos]